MKKMIIFLAFGVLGASGASAQTVNPQDSFNESIRIIGIWQPFLFYFGLVLIVWALFRTFLRYNQYRKKIIKRSYFRKVRFVNMLWFFVIVFWFLVLPVICWTYSIKQNTMFFVILLFAIVCLCGFTLYTLKVVGTLIIMSINIRQQEKVAQAEADNGYTIGEAEPIISHLKKV